MRVVLWMLVGCGTPLAPVATLPPSSPVTAVPTPPATPVPTPTAPVPTPTPPVPTPTPPVPTPTPPVPTPTAPVPTPTPPVPTPPAPTPPVPTPTPPVPTPCPEGRSCNPIPIGSFPYTDSRDTTGVASEIDAYSCDYGIDESGGEFFYSVSLSEEGFLEAYINEIPGDGIDIDVHLLETTAADTCLDRDHEEVGRQLPAGDYVLVLDTWNGPSEAGPYMLTVDFRPGSVDCSYDAQNLRMRWSSCSLSDCFSSGGDRFISLPSSGPVVKEAHLVTQGESFSGTWPNSFTQGISNHYAVSESASGYGMNRAEPWAPAGEGGSQFGQGSTGSAIPVLDEAWYITMNWRDRPAGGTRMLVKNPSNGRVVVASAGWETGPGATTSLAGVTEEIHDWLGTNHLSTLEVGFASDQALPLGPLVCP